MKWRESNIYIYIVNYSMELMYIYRVEFVYWLCVGIYMYEVIRFFFLISFEFYLLLELC